MISIKAVSAYPLRLRFTPCPSSRWIITFMRADFPDVGGEVKDQGGALLNLTLVKVAAAARSHDGVGLVVRLVSSLANIGWSHASKPVQVQEEWFAQAIV